MYNVNCSEAAGTQSAHGYSIVRYLFCSGTSCTTIPLYSMWARQHKRSMKIELQSYRKLETKENFNILLQCVRTRIQNIQTTPIINDCMTREYYASTIEVESPIFAYICTYM